MNGCQGDLLGNIRSRLVEISVKDIRKLHGVTATRFCACPVVMPVRSPASHQFLGIGPGALMQTNGVEVCQQLLRSMPENSLLNLDAGEYEQGYCQRHSKASPCN